VKTILDLRAMLGLRNMLLNRSFPELENFLNRAGKLCIHSIPKCIPLHFDEIEYNLGNPAVRYSDTFSNPGIRRQTSVRDLVQVSISSRGWLVFSRAWQTDLFRPSLVHSVSVLQDYTFLYSTFHKVVDLLTLFFCKKQWNEALNIEVMDRNSQYTFMYVK
jgi:hypothetical protein